MNLKIKTDRLILMPPTLADAQKITELVGDQDVSCNLGRVPFPYTEDDAKFWIEKVSEDIQTETEFAFGVYVPGIGLIGSCGVTRRGAYWEIGYWFGKPYWEQGFATEAAEAVLDWARREIPAKGFVSGHIAENVSSGRVLKKIGFHAVGEKMMYAKARGERVRAVRYCLDAPPEAALTNDHHHGDSHD